jgi:hypothetical protein
MPVQFTSSYPVSLLQDMLVEEHLYSLQTTGHPNLVVYKKSNVQPLSHIYFHVATQKLVNYST